MSKQRMYHTSRWAKLRAQQLKVEPLCAYCLARGMVSPATVVDHVVPHRGDRGLFYKGKLQSLCASHHSKDKQSEETRGYSLGIGVDGIPNDPMHPANKASGDAPEGRS